MITKQDLQTVRRALIECTGDSFSGDSKQWDAIAILDAALAQPEQEPVAWMSPGKERLEFSRPDTVYGSHTIPLYAAPVAQPVNQMPVKALKRCIRYGDLLPELKAEAEAALAAVGEK